MGLAIHNHQPEGNFSWVFEDAYRHAYLPMLEALERHPSVCASLHYSGCLIDWLLSAHPEFFKRLQEMLRRGQIELMGGGYYEPILPSIPVADSYGQIMKMSDFIESNFSSRPTGMWLAERVWEPSLPSVLSQTKIEWTLLDDTAFKMVGKDIGELNSYYITEDQGCALKVFPISKHLRYSIPWHTVDRVIKYLYDNAIEGGKGILVLGDDGEKFGVWPETYQHCWERGWVDDFFTAIEQNSEWLSTVRLGDYASHYPSQGRVYLPCASYEEMMEWSLPSDKAIELIELKHKLANQEQALQYINSGFWRNFMARYPEVNRMHKKMLLVHEKVYRARMLKGDEGCGLDYLWQAQCNCPYWHGVFGGIYLTDIRAMTYRNLVKAESIADGILNERGSNHCIREFDFDADNNVEVLMEDSDFNLYFSPAEGGSLFEWDLRQQAYNLLSTMTRRPEWYHKKLLENAKNIAKETVDGSVKSIHDVIRIKEDGAELVPVYDKLPRSSLLDHFFGRDVLLKDFANNNFMEMGGFTTAIYQYRVDENRLLLACEAGVQAQSATVELRIEKTIIPFEGQQCLRVEYRFTNKGDVPLDSIFGCEWNFNLLGGGHNESAYFRVEGTEIGDTHLDSTGEIVQTKYLVMGNSYLGIELKLTLDRPLTLWRFPVESLSNSEGGIERVYQANCLLILLPLQLDPARELHFEYTWQVKTA